MPDTAVHVEVVLANIDGLPKDEFVTSFNYTTTAVDSTGVTPAVHDFFNTAGTGQTHAINYYLSGAISGASNACQVRYYDVTAHLDGSPHGAPFQVDDFTVTNASANNLPSQLAAVISYYDALDVEGTTTGRHRGRMYIGPVSSLAVDHYTGTNNPLLSAAMQTDLAAAFTNLYNALQATTPLKDLAVWSRKDSSMLGAIGGWIPNDVNTQRRRKYGPTGRTTFAL